MAEALVLDTIQCRFESDLTYQTFPGGGNDGGVTPDCKSGAFRLTLLVRIQPTGPIILALVSKEMVPIV